MYLLYVSIYYSWALKKPQIQVPSDQIQSFTKRHMPSGGSSGASSTNLFIYSCFGPTPQAKTQCQNKLPMNPIRNKLNALIVLDTMTRQVKAFLICAQNAVELFFFSAGEVKFSREHLYESSFRDFIIHMSSNTITDPFQVHYSALQVPSGRVKGARLHVGQPESSASTCS